MQANSFGGTARLTLARALGEQPISQMLSYINRRRTQYGLSCLTLDARLYQAAKEHAEEMLNTIT
jgi:uncharacterized protein YkwD